MANEDGVFGTPMTNEILEGMPEYAKKLRHLRATAAFDDKKADSDKYQKALEFVRKLKDEFGNGVSTLSLVYNATGGPIRFVTSHDWWGHIFDGCHYPAEIGNGQWGAYLHVKATAAASGSNAAVVYRGKNDAGEDTDIMFAWDTPWGPYSNKVYSEIHEAGYFDRIDWQSILDDLEKSGKQHRATWKGCVANVRIEGGTSPLFHAELSLGQVNFKHVGAAAADVVGDME